jgi:hypothetical protein
LVGYLRIPQTCVAKTVALGTALVTAAPDHAPEAVHRVAGKLENVTETLESDHGLRNPSSQAGEVRKRARSLGRAWGALYRVLNATVEIPVACPSKEAARALLASLFPDGLRFVSRAYRDLWFHSAVRLRKIEEEDLETKLEGAVANPEFLRAVRETHGEFARALRITEAEPMREIPNLNQGIAAVREVMVEYVIQVIAWAQQDGGEYLNDALLALKPIGTLRAGVTRRRASSSDTDEQETSEAESASTGSDPPPSLPILRPETERPASAPG